MVKAKKGKNNKKSTPATSQTTVNGTTTTTGSTVGNSSTSTTPSSSSMTGTSVSSSRPLNTSNDTMAAAVSSSSLSSPNMTSMAPNNSVLLSSAAAASKATHYNNTSNRKEDLDDLNWLREIEMRQTSNGEPMLLLEYKDDDDSMTLLYRFLDESSANTEIIDAIYQIWQQTVLSTLLQSSAIWKKEAVTQRDQKNMKDTLKVARLKINFIFHHLIGNILISNMKKWSIIRERVIDMCYNTLQLIPRLVESCQHHPTDIRLAIIHYEGKEFLASVACETWDTLYDYSIQIDPNRFVPVLRRCAMLDILDKDWNMLGGWDDILKGIETKCCNNYHNNSNNNNNNGSMKTTNYVIPRLPSDYILHETTTILRNARNSMQCKFFSVRFMRYTDDQAPQRYKYYPKCSAPACANIETSNQIHPYRCTKCWYFHYCSSSCQEYCDNIMGLHNKFCTDTPKSKAMLCQKETELYLGWNLGSMGNINNSTNYDEDEDEDDDDYVIMSKLAAAQAVVLCHSCGVPEDNLLKMTSSKLSVSSSAWHNLIKMKRCIQCQRVSYCSKQCQEWDWRVGGHRDICTGSNGIVAANSNTTTTTIGNLNNTTTTTGSTTVGNSNNNSNNNNNNNTTTKNVTTQSSTSTTATTTMVKDLN